MNTTRDRKWFPGQIFFFSIFCPFPSNAALLRINYGCLGQSRTPGIICGMAYATPSETLSYICIWYGMMEEEEANQTEAKCLAVVALVLRIVPIDDVIFSGDKKKYSKTM